MTLPDMIDLPMQPRRREPEPPNEHLIPFAEVTWDRLEKGIWHHVRDLRLSGAMTEFRRLPDGTLFMHPADKTDLLTSEPSDRLLYLAIGNDWWTRPFGYDLLCTQHPAYVRRGRPRLHLTDGTDVLL